VHLKHRRFEKALPKLIVLDIQFVVSELTAVLPFVDHHCEKKSKANSGAEKIFFFSILAS